MTFIKGKVCDVQWDDSDGVDLWKSHTDFLEAAGDNVKGDVMTALYLLTEPWFDDRTNSTRMILPILEVGSALAPATSDEATNLPRDFFEALIREDWRDWVSAVNVWHQTPPAGGHAFDWWNAFWLNLYEKYAFLGLGQNVF